jgi:hypothetical protein
MPVTDLKGPGRPSPPTIWIISGMRVPGVILYAMVEENNLETTPSFHMEL